MVLWSKSSNYGEKLRCHACDERTDERTDGGKWKIEQCSVRPETATIHILEKYSLINVLGDGIVTGQAGLIGWAGW